ncbi:hypothetical protein QT970_09740 [Microcoleus sp. herbarium8]|uniref:hypothetical protein n=1 Tax=Microcoleus sp. herbarium8 TaxID=3055436 RepID=UPI002FD212DE
MDTNLRDKFLMDNQSIANNPQASSVILLKNISKMSIGLDPDINLTLAVTGDRE